MTNQITTTTNKLPNTLRGAFQEYNFEDLDLTKDSRLIIERTLAYGVRSELQWLFKYYGRPRLTEWVKKMGSSRLPWRRYNLWCVLLKLPIPKKSERRGTGIWQY